LRDESFIIALHSFLRNLVTAFQRVLRQFVVASRKAVMTREVAVPVQAFSKHREPRHRQIALACLPLLLVCMANLAHSGYVPAPSQALGMKAAGPGAWVEVKNEKPALSLQQTPFAGLPTKVATYVHNDGSRNDWIKAGALLLAPPNVNFSIVRQTAAKPLTYTVVRNLEDIAELGMVWHSYRPTYYALNTRFGELRGVMFDVAADGIRKYCVGFHKPVSNLVFVKGFVCAPAAAEATPQRVACLIDQIRFVSPADEDAMKASLEPDEARQCGATALDPTSNAKNNKESL
jgi:hypothetical protein